MENPYKMLERHIGEIMTYPALCKLISEDAKSVYAALNDTPKHASELELELGMSTGKILAALTELELFGLIKTYPGQRFTKA